MQVPGHELAGVVTEVGAHVLGIQAGDQVGVGCIVDSCMNCRTCEESQVTMVKNSPMSQR